MESEAAIQVDRHPRTVTVDQPVRPTPPTTSAAPRHRSTLRSVGLPSEHGGWGLMLEPVLLGLVVAPSAAGLCLAVAAALCLLVRTPVKTVLVDLSRGRRLHRTRVAAVLAGIELVVIAILGLAVLSLADGAWWIPVLLAAPLVVTELWYDMRSRGRRLTPELAGAIGMSGVVAAIVLADGADARLAGALWIVLAARTVTSIPFVRGQIFRIRGRKTAGWTLIVSDALAITAAAGAVVLDRSLLAGAVAVLGVVAIQRISATKPPPRAVIIGMRQMGLGLAVAVFAAIGVLAA
jgi:hypothetical protein